MAYKAESDIYQLLVTQSAQPLYEVSQAYTTVVATTVPLSGGPIFLQGQVLS